MADNHLKADLTKLLILYILLMVVLVGLVIWDKNSGILVKIAGNWMN